MSTGIRRACKKVAVVGLLATLERGVSVFMAHKDVASVQQTPSSTSQQSCMIQYDSMNVFFPHVFAVPPFHIFHIFHLLSYGMWIVHAKGNRGFVLLIVYFRLRSVGPRIRATRTGARLGVSADGKASTKAVRTGAAIAVVKRSELSS